MSRFEEVVIKDGDTGVTAAVEDNDGQGCLAVCIQDQVTPTLMVYANIVNTTTTLAAATAIDDYDVIVTSNAGLVIGDYVGIFSIAGSRFYTGTILNIVGTTITLDTPLNFDYQIGDAFQAGSKELNVDGSVTPVIFSLRADPDLAITVDVTRIIIHILDGTAMDDARFGGLVALTRGVVVRRVDGTYRNIFNVKTNGEIGEIAYDKSYDDKAPAGLYGLSARLTFAGTNKMGVVIRLAPDEDLQVIIQDDLTGLDSFRIMIEGHVVQN